MVWCSVLVILGITVQVTRDGELWSLCDEQTFIIQHAGYLNLQHKTDTNIWALGKGVVVSLQYHNTYTDYHRMFSG